MKRGGKIREKEAVSIVIETHQGMESRLGSRNGIPSE